MYVLNQHNPSIDQLLLVILLTEHRTVLHSHWAGVLHKEKKYLKIFSLEANILKLS